MSKAITEAMIRDAFNQHKKTSLKALASYYDFAAGYEAALSVPLPEIEGGDKGDGWPTDKQVVDAVKAYIAVEGKCRPAAMRSALSAAIAQKQYGWKPANTAPKHKSIILCTWWKDHGEAPFISEGYLDWDGVTWRDQAGRPLSPDRSAPTHWQPLPDAPSLAAPSASIEGETP